MGRVIVIGAGPSGMMAAIFAARTGSQVLLLEKNAQPGKKLLLTGGGRCNLTNTFAGEELLIQYPGGGPFLYSALSQFPPQGLCAFFQELGVELTMEDEGRVFPKSGQAKEVLMALERELARLQVDVRYHRRLNSLPTKREAQIIVATGGVTYPRTGSTGDGYRFAREAGHKIISPRPALAPLKLEERWLSSLCGLSLFVQAKLKVGKRVIRQEGELLLTHFGLSGPLALNLSRHLTGEAPLELNFLPQLEQEELFQTDSTIGQRLDRLLPHRLNRQLLALAQIEPAARQLSVRQKEQLAKCIFALPLTVVGTGPIERAMVTRGGVELKEVDPKTMASKLRPGLYFAGEVLNLDGICGGYNLTAAFATGAIAGRAAARSSENG